jgi:prolyl-tRNA editing enzyme YbaK/EbsC (Cys-tRNA(Pro) deacylase)
MCSRARLDLDEALRTNDRIAASAGSLTDSIILAMPDYLRIAAPNDSFALSVAAQ